MVLPLGPELEAALKEQAHRHFHRRVIPAILIRKANCNTRMPGSANSRCSATTSGVITPKASATSGTQCYACVELADRAIVVRANDFVVTSLDPFEGMFVPSQAPAHITGFPNLVRPAIGFGDVSKREFRQAGIMIDAIGVGNVSPQFIRWGIDRNLPDELQIHTT